MSVPLKALADVSFEFESGCSEWTLDPAWGCTDHYARTGSYSLTDSPGDDYANSQDSSAIITVDLLGSERPLLTFYQWYSLEAYKDYGYVEVKVEPDGEWKKLSFATGHLSGDPNDPNDWERVRIDLGEYYNKKISLRFRLITDSANRYDGWYIDDVSITENSAVLNYPFFDDFEGGPDNWLTSGWKLDPFDYYSHTNAMTDSLDGNHVDYVSNAMTLAGVFDLTGAVNPVCGQPCFKILS